MEIPARAWIVPALSVLVLMAVCSKARASEIPCWKVQAVRSWTGSDSAAEALARKHGYSKAQIEEAKRRCK